MDSSLEDFFRGDYMPHGHCYLWQPGILWTNVISDLLIATAYFSIPIALFIFARRRKGEAFTNMLILFAVFILSCGVTHLYSIYTIWHGSYGVHGITKAITAVASMLTAFVLFKNLDKLISIPTPKEFEIAQQQAIDEQVKNVMLEAQNKANAKYQHAIELIPTGVIVVDKNQTIQITNKMLEKTFEYSNNELIGQDLSVLLDPKTKSNHGALAANYLKSGDNRLMAGGRLVWGQTKTGGAVPVEISLSKHEVDNEVFTFASIVNASHIGFQRKQFIESSQRLQRLIEATDVGLWEWNTLTNKIWFSPRLLQLLDIESNDDEVLFENWKNHIHPEDRKQVFEALDEHIKHQAPYSVMYRGRNRQNEYRWLKTTGDSINDDSGKAILMSGTMTDMHEIQTLQNELQSKNQFLDAVLKNSPSVTFIIDIQQKSIVFVNNKIKALCGFKPSDMDNSNGRALFDTIVHSEDRPHLRQHIDVLEQSAENQIKSIEFRVQHKNGTLVWCLSNNSVYKRDKNGNVKEILGSILDISPIKEREEANKRLSQEFLDTFELAAVGIAHVSEEGGWLRVNQKICDILGYEKPELMQKTFQDITHPEDLEKDLALVSDLLEGRGKSYSMVKRYKHKQGHWIWSRLSVAIVEPTLPFDRYFISVIEDISDEKNLKNELLRSNQELEQFAYVASHDLKEPLRTIRTYTSYLIKDIEAEKTERVIQDKQFIDSATFRMTKLIDDLLSFSRVGSSPLEKTETDLGILINEVVADIQVQIGDEKAEIQTGEAFPTLKIDPSKLRVAIQNLVQNAIKFCKADVRPKIHIWSEVRDDGVTLLHVKDNGIGIKPEYQQQIFGLFKRLHSEQEYEGTGLGLAIVHKIMNQLGGDVTLSSTYGEGTTITLILPTT